MKDINKAKIERFTKRVELLKRKIYLKNKEDQKKEIQKNWKSPCLKLYELKEKFHRNPKKDEYNYDKYKLYKNNSTKNISSPQINDEFERISKRIKSKHRSNSYSESKSIPLFPKKIKSSHISVNNTLEKSGSCNLIPIKRSFSSLLSPKPSITSFSPSRKEILLQNKCKKEKKFGSSFKLISNKVKNLPLYTVKIGDLVSQFKNINVQMKKETFNYKSRHFMSYQEVDNLIETRKQMKILSLKRKYFGCRFPEKPNVSVKSKKKFYQDLNNKIELLEEQIYVNKQEYY